MPSFLDLFFFSGQAAHLPPLQVPPLQVQYQDQKKKSKREQKTSFLFFLTTSDIINEFVFLKYRTDSTVFF
jgi:hypothetical protein